MFSTWYVVHGGMGRHVQIFATGRDGTVKCNGSVLRRAGFKILVVQERLNKIKVFVLYGMAVRLDMRPSVQVAAASTCLCGGIIFHCFHSTRSSTQR